MSNTNPLIHLKENVATLTNAQRTIADYILRHSSEVAFLTIHQLADRVQTSTTTIMRLTSKLGYTGYSEFQKGLQQLVKEQAAPPNRLELNLTNVDQEDLWGATIHHHLFHIQQMEEQLPQEQLTEAVEKIRSARRIFCSSVRSGLPVGQYLSQGLNRSLGNCQFLLADASDWVDEVITMQPGDMVIATSFPRYAKRIMNLTKAAKEKEAEVIAITDSYAAPVVQYADIVLPCDSTSLAFHNSPIAAMVVADYLINATAIAQSEETKERLNQVNQLLTTMNYHSIDPEQE